MTDDSRDARPGRQAVSAGVWASLLVLVAVALYVGSYRPALPPGAPAPGPAIDQESSPNPGADDDPQRRSPTIETAATDGEPSRVETRIDDVIVRDREGRVEFRGTVDLEPTLLRIERGERLRFAHDGARFQNRERQLPHKPAGYYHEYVHPTPGISGPGAQRVIVGRQGEVYYTFDHYRTFRRIK